MDKLIIFPHFLPSLGVSQLSLPLTLSHPYNIFGEGMGENVKNPIVSTPLAPLPQPHNIPPCAP